MPILDIRADGPVARPDAPPVNISLWPSFSKWQSGWVAGAGTEYHIGGTGWILGAEYLYYGLNDGANRVAVLTSVPAGSPAGGCTSAAPFPCNPVGFGRFGVQELRARLSYKF